MHSKKKLKRSKKRMLNTLFLCKENLLGKDCSSSDLGPSTSEKSSTITLSSVHCGRKKAANDTALKNVNNSVGSLMKAINREFKERIYQNGTILATDQKVEGRTGSVSEANWNNSREIDSLKDGKTGASLQRHVRTKDLGEATVARWDDNGFTSPVQTIEANGRESITIGHVLDEWDEEYDRGKRKKIRRHKHEFGGPNLFQQIATKITQLKKAKLDHSNSENRPFSI